MIWPIHNVEQHYNPHHDIEDIVVKETKEVGEGRMAVRYDFTVVSRFDRKWRLRRTQTRVFDPRLMRDERIRQILE